MTPLRQATAAACDGYTVRHGDDEAYYGCVSCEHGQSCCECFHDALRRSRRMGHGAQVTRGGVVVSIALAHVLAPFPRIVSERTEQRARAHAVMMARIDEAQEAS